MNLIKLLPSHTNFDFIRYRVWTFPVSTLLVIGSLLLFTLIGVNTGIDFSSGIRFTIKLNEGADDIAAIRNEVDGLGLGDFQLQVIEGESAIMLRLEDPPGGDSGQAEAIRKVEERLAPRIKESSYEAVGPTASEALIRGGVLAVFVANLLIIVYLWMRFEWPFAVGAVIALAHDVLSTLGMFTLTGLEFNLTAVIAILTIIGYSLNDTVVVFDRIRETLQKNKRMSITEAINRAVNETLARTFATTTTTLLALIGLYVLGPDAIKSFTVAMIWGVIVGTYSSTFIAAPMLIFINLDVLELDETGRPIKKDKSKKTS